MNQQNWRPLALSLTVAGAVARMLPHPPNFAPVGAVSVFAGARLPKWQAYTIPIVLMMVTDPILNVMRGYPAFTWYQAFTYISFMISVWIGRRVRATDNALAIGGAVLVSSAQFFLISNLGSWLYDYPHTFPGLASCYIAAIPFFEKTLLSDFFFTGVLFGLHFVLSRNISTRERVPVSA